MDRIDPNYLFDQLIKIRDDCPPKIRYITRWIKSWVIHNDVDLEAADTLDYLTKFFTKWVNESTPQKFTWIETKIKEEVARERIKEAINWLLTKGELDEFK